MNPYLVELVNLKSQCSRVHRWQSELANRKAVELVRIAVGRVLLNQAVHKKIHRSRPSVLVIGGGVSGMTAALAIADSGYQVHLVERSEVLGGNLQNIYYVAEGYNPRRLGRDLINRVRAHQNIRALTRSEVIRLEGHVGFFRSDIKTTNLNGSSETFRIEHGVTIVATGGKEGNNHPWLSLPNVITQQQLEKKLSTARRRSPRQRMW